MKLNDLHGDSFEEALIQAMITPLGEESSSVWLMYTYRTGNVRWGDLA